MNMAENTQVAVVLGVGPKNGLGAALCRRMSQEGLHVLVSGRTESSLSVVVEEVQSLGGDASFYVADATSEQDIERLFEEARSLGAISVAIYNAGNNFPGTIIDMDADYFESTWRVCCFGGFYLVARRFVQCILASGGTLIFTGASASLRGRANFGAFNSAKARSGISLKRWLKSMPSKAFTLAMLLSMVRLMATKSPRGFQLMLSGWARAA